jgi:hypothetical protein
MVWRVEDVKEVPKELFPAYNGVDGSVKSRET